MTKSQRDLRALFAGVAAAAVAAVPIYVVWVIAMLIVEELAGGSVLFGAPTRYPWWHWPVAMVITAQALASDVLVGLACARRVRRRGLSVPPSQGQSVSNDRS